MDKKKFDKKINNLIIIGEGAYLFLFGTVIFALNKHKPFKYDNYILLFVVLLYIFSAFRYHSKTKEEKYEHYYDEFGRDKINKKIYKSKWKKIDKIIYLLVIIIGMVFGFLMLGK